MSDVDEDIQQIHDAGLLTERQAEAFVLRDVEAVPRAAVADSMGISVNVLDKHLGAARKKLETARSTVDAVGDVRFEDIPEFCADCGDPLGGKWTTNEDDEPVCIKCGLDNPEEALL